MTKNTERAKRGQSKRMIEKRAVHFSNATQNIECFALSCVAKIQILVFIDKYRPFFGIIERKITPNQTHFPLIPHEKNELDFFTLKKKHIQIFLSVPNKWERERKKETKWIYIFFVIAIAFSLFACEPISNEISFYNIDSIGTRERDKKQTCTKIKAFSYYVGHVILHLFFNFSNGVCFSLSLSIFCSWTAFHYCWMCVENGSAMFKANRASNEQRKKLS